MGGMIGEGELEALHQTLHPHDNFHFLFEQKSLLLTNTVWACNVCHAETGNCLISDSRSAFQLNSYYCSFNISLLPHAVAAGQNEKNLSLRFFC